MAKRSKRKRPPGRPPHHPTIPTRAQVEALIAFGRPHEEIARFLGISHPTLRRHYAREIEIGLPKALLNVGMSLYDMAVGRRAQVNEQGVVVRAELQPTPSAAIFMLKARGSWREVVEVDNAKDEAGQPIPFRITRRDEKL